MSTQEQSGATAAADTHSPDVVVVGAGTAGCYAAATIARADYEVVILERKSEDEAGHIACGDALKGASAFPEAIPREQIEPAFTNTGVDHGRFEIPQEDTVLEIPVPGELAVIDRWDYGKRIIEGAQDAGAEIHYDTVVQDVTQADDEKGTVTGVEATNKASARPTRPRLSSTPLGRFPSSRTRSTSRTRRSIRTSTTRTSVRPTARSSPSRNPCRGTTPSSSSPPSARRATSGTSRAPTPRSTPDSASR